MQLQRRPDACWGKVPVDGVEHGVLWSPIERRLHLLNPTAAAVWEQLSVPTKLEDLVDDLAERFETSPSIIGKDVAVLVALLTQSELLCDSADAEIILPVDDPEPKFELPGENAPEAPRAFGSGPLRVLGCTMVVESNDARLSESLASILAPLRDHTVDRTQTPVIHLTANKSEAGWDIATNGTINRTVTTPEFALRSVLSEVNAAPLEVQTSSVVLHASGATFNPSIDPQNSLVVFPGVSNSGKSTLVAQLIARGHEYLTDEAVAIEINSLEAQPYHKAICVEPTAQTVLREMAHAAAQPLLSSTWDVDPRLVGAGRLSNGGPIRAFVFPTYTPGAQTELTPVDSLDTLHRLIANAFDFAAIGQPAFAALVQLANTVPAFTLTHGGDDDHLTILEERFG